MITRNCDICGKDITKKRFSLELDGPWKDDDRYDLYCKDEDGDKKDGIDALIAERKEFELDLDVCEDCGNKIREYTLSIKEI